MNNKFQKQCLGVLLLVLGSTLIGVLCNNYGDFLWASLFPALFLVFFVYMVDDIEIDHDHAA